MTGDEIRLRVERRGQVYRRIDDVSGRLARDGSGEEIDYGGFRRRSQAERVARLLESEARRRMRTGYRPEASNDKVEVQPAVTVDDDQAMASLAPPTYHGGSVRVVVVDRARGIVTLAGR
jgi:hypothetical protein